MPKIVNNYSELRYNEEIEKIQRKARCRKMKKGDVIRSGISMGTALAMVISWSLNQSVLWAIIHGVFSWLYVLYYLIIIN